jgi:hypothetical protein
MVCSYVYDSLGQLVRENNVEDNKTYVWNYDSLGNIESLLVYDYTTGAVSNPESGIDYQYTNDNKEGWNKLLTTLVYKEYIYNEAHPNGTPDVISTETVNYDKIGNPTNYQGATMSWFGRQMTSYSVIELAMDLISEYRDALDNYILECIKNQKKNVYIMISWSLQNQNYVRTTTGFKWKRTSIHDYF